MLIYLRLCNIGQSAACGLSLQLQLYSNVIGLNDETGKLSFTSFINCCRLWKWHLELLNQKFPYSSIQCDIYILQLICLSSSYDHFFAADNGDLPLTNCG